MPRINRDDYSVLQQEDDVEGTQLSEKPSSPKRNADSGSSRLVFILLILNILVACGSMFVAGKAALLLGKHEKKDLSELPRPNPYVGLPESAIPQHVANSGSY